MCNYCQRCILYFIFILVFFLGCKHTLYRNNSNVIYPYIAKLHHIEKSYDNVRWLLMIWHVKHLPTDVKVREDTLNCEKILLRAVVSIDTNCIKINNINKDTFYFSNTICSNYISNYRRIMYMFPDYVSVEKKSNTLLFQELDVAKIPLRDTLIIENFTDSLRINIFIDFLNRNRYRIPAWLEQEAIEHELIKK